MATAPVRRIRGLLKGPDGGRGRPRHRVLGPGPDLFRCRRRGSGRGRRPQRCGQDHASQDPLQDHAADNGQGRDARSGELFAGGRDRIPSRAHRPRERVPERLDHGYEPAEIRAKFDEIVAFSEVERFIETPVKHYSSGMQVRLAFAVAAHLEPEILFIDEVLSSATPRSSASVSARWRRCRPEAGRFSSSATTWSRSRTSVIGSSGSITAR